MSSPNPALPVEPQEDPVLPPPPMTPRPETPPNKQGTPTDDIQSTPGSAVNGISTHAASGEITGLDRTVVRSWIRDDMKQRMDTTSFDDMLKYMLSLCVRDGVIVDKDTLLKDCLDDVLSLCEEQECDLVKTLLKQCEQAAEEKDRYAPLVKLVNKAFDQLDGLTGNGVSQLRSAPKWDGGEAVMLVRNDPAKIAGRHSGGKTSRSPDLAIIAEHAAERVYPDFRKEARAPDASGSPRVGCQCLEKDPGHVVLEWTEIKAVFELKMTHKKLPEPRLPYVRGAKYEKFEYPPWKDGKSRKRSAKPFRQANQPTLSKSVPPGGDDAEEEDTFDCDSQPAPVTGSKRKTPASDFVESGTAKKQKEDPQRMPYDIKMGSYAAERLCCLPCMMHSIDILMHDDVLWIFWFDRQGVIQTHGMNWVADFPRFLVLLLALQRFNNRNWGVPDGFPERVPISRPEKIGPPSRFASLQQPASSSELHFPEHVEQLVPSDDPDVPTTTVTTPATTVTVDWNSPIYCKYQLFGRATQVYSAKIANSQDDLVVKISFPDKSRVSEPRIIRIAEHANVEPNDVFKVKDHLPGLICTMDVPGCDTGDIRESVGLMKTEQDGYRRRVVRVSVFVKIEQIYILPAKDFLRCFLEIVHCHYVLWGAGVYHNDPSVGNIGIRKINGVYHGVLNDWDLATILGLSTPWGLERTGTLPFMAIHLLCKEFWEGKLVRLYRHELEGYIWKLPWIFLQYGEDRKRRDHSEINAWLTHDLTQLARNKLAFASNASRPHDVTPLTPWTALWSIVRGLMTLVRNATNTRPRPFAPPSATEIGLDGEIIQPPPPKTLDFSREVEYQLFWTVLKQQLTDRVFKEMRGHLGLAFDMPDLPQDAADLLKL
ncbi:hypothetical protein OF83DRAFT_1285953 [Amylostereum chailletii]|nr:hypothetical protein OF83DRAFT_1285953 [Amylostereum chailletii]